MKKICRTLSAIFQRVYYQLFAIWQSLIAKLWAPTVFTTMITTSSLQNYKKVIEYGRFSQKLKIIAKILATFRNNVYLCTQNNGRVPFIGIGVSPIGRQWTCSIYWDWGVPDRKSCQVRGDSFFIHKKNRPLFFVYNKNVAHNQHFFKKKLLGNSKKTQTNDSYDR